MMRVTAGRRSMAGLVVAVVALVSAVLALGPTGAGAQADVELAHNEAELTPTEASAGDDVTVRSVGDGCVSGSGNRAGLVWAVFPRGEFVWGEHLGWEPADAVASGVGHPNDVGGTFGAWSVTFPAPDLGEDPPGGGEIGPGSPVTSPVLSVYGPLPFTVDGHDLDFVAKCYLHPPGPGDITISPEVPELGGSATITPEDPCPMPHTQGGSVAVELWSAPATNEAPFPIDIADVGAVPVAGDGSWSATFDIPDDPDRRYAVAARCVNVEGGHTFGYWLTPFDVREPSGPPIQTPPGFWDDPSGPRAPAMPSPTAAPARPVRAEPTYTG